LRKAHPCRLASVFHRANGQDGDAGESKELVSQRDGSGVFG